MNEVLEKLGNIGIVPVVKLDRAEDALPLAKALCGGGLPCAEVTFRTEAAAEAIRIMTENFPQMCVGAGTVLNPRQVDAAVEAGAGFIVSPGLNPRTVRYCQEKKVPMVPGVSTPSDMEQAIELGLEVVKFFPAEQSGGLGKIKAMAAPYTGMKFLPTGGINAGNLNSYLGYDKVIACGGSWMVPSELVEAGEWDRIQQLTREAVHTMLGFDLAHIGLNCQSEPEARKAAERLAFLFGLPQRINTGGTFVGEIVEVLNTPFRGTHGHIAIWTNYIERAVHYMTTVLGVEFFEPARDEQGKYVAIYMKEEIGGFAVHLMQRKK